MRGLLVGLIIPSVVVGCDDDFMVGVRLGDWARAVFFRDTPLVTEVVTVLVGGWLLVNHYAFGESWVVAVLLPVEEVVAANPRTFFQVYWSGSREVIAERIDRARAPGCVGLIATLDWSFSMGQDWGGPRIPEHINLTEALRFAPQVLAWPSWLAHAARTRWIPDLTAPNTRITGQAAPTFFGVYGEWMQTPPPSWDDVVWLRKQWDGPFRVKGITRVDEARRAVDAGATAVSVSNHGGNNLDTPATIRILPAIADAVGADIEVLLDGGIRRGSDIVKALALGARAVMIGRAYLWGLAANGQAGVENVLDILRSGIDSALMGLCRSSVRDLTPDDVLVPRGFTRVLGASTAVQAFAHK